MASSKTRTAKEADLMDVYVEGIPGEDETECADDLWAYIEAHKDEVEELDECTKKRDPAQVVVDIQRKSRVNLAVYARPHAG
jgi:hypothetical protein